MEKDGKKSVVNHFEAGANCQVFNGSVSGCVFAMPGSTVTQQTVTQQTVTQQTAITAAVVPHDERVEIPDVLTQSEPWQELVEAGLIDENGQPTVSRPEAALMAYMLAGRLKIANKWKLFEQLWHRNNMRNDYNTALNQRKSLEFQERMKKLLY
jgi:hypothetical protein